MIARCKSGNVQQSIQFSFDDLFISLVQLKTHHTTGATAVLHTGEYRREGIRHLKNVRYDFQVLQHVVSSVQEEAGGHTIEALRLMRRAVHVHKLASGHAHLPKLCCASSRQDVWDMDLPALWICHPRFIDFKGYMEQLCCCTTPNVDTRGLR